MKGLALFKYLCYKRAIEAYRTTTKNGSKEVKMNGDNVSAKKADGKATAIFDVAEYVETFHLVALMCQVVLVTCSKFKRALEGGEQIEGDVVNVLEYIERISEAMAPLQPYAFAEFQQAQLLFNAAKEQIRLLETQVKELQEEKVSLALDLGEARANLELAQIYDKEKPDSTARAVETSTDLPAAQEALLPEGLIPISPPPIALTEELPGAEEDLSVRPINLTDLNNEHEANETLKRQLLDEQRARQELQQKYDQLEAVYTQACGQNLTAPSPRAISEAEAIQLQNESQLREEVLKLQGLFSRVADVLSWMFEGTACGASFFYLAFLILKHGIRSGAINGQTANAAAEELQRRPLNEIHEEIMWVGMCGQLHANFPLPSLNGSVEGKPRMLIQGFEAIHALYQQQNLQRRD